MNNKALVLLSFLFLFCLQGHKSLNAMPHKPQESIVDFGPKGDGKTINTSAIQQAIDQTIARGGGTVYIPSGVFLSGTLLIRSILTYFWKPERF